MTYECCESDIYCMTRASDGAVKIGRSSAPKTRRAELQAQHKSAVVLHFSKTFATPLTSIIELQTKRELRAHVLGAPQSEWFNVSLVDALTVLMQQIEKASSR